MRSPAAVVLALLAAGCRAQDAAAPAAPVTGEATNVVIPASAGPSPATVASAETPDSAGPPPHVADGEEPSTDSPGIIGLVLTYDASDLIAQSARTGPGNMFPADVDGGGPHGGAPTMREGGTSVNGRLPLEEIQRIVRMHFPVLRNCYLAGLQKNPNLAGRVGVRFMIDRQGNVSYAADGGSDLPDQDVVHCIVGVFHRLTFPAPQGGTVSVSYPLVFAPG